MASGATVPVRGGSWQGVSRRDGKEEGREDPGSSPKPAVPAPTVSLLPAVCLLEGSHSDYTCPAGSARLAPLVLSMSQELCTLSPGFSGFLRPNLLEGFSSQAPPAIGGGGARLGIVNVDHTGRVPPVLASCPLPQGPGRRSKGLSPHAGAPAPPASFPDSASLLHVHRRAHLRGGRPQLRRYLALRLCRARLGLCGRGRTRHPAWPFVSSPCVSAPVSNLCNCPAVRAGRC